jgi:hypothetical protein
MMEVIIVAAVLGLCARVGCAHAREAARTITRD